MHEPYAAYAAIYDRIGQGAFGEELAHRTLRWMDVTGEPLRVLDLACGTGAASLVFAAAGHSVTGVDLSIAMLERARHNAAFAGLAVDFVAGDLRDLERATLASGFDLVTCFFDSLNYLIGDDDLVRVCAAVATLLRPGGTFVFDLHTEAEFATWDERDEVMYDADDLLVYNRLEYDALRRRGTGRVVWFTRTGDRWWRHEEAHVERPWSDAAVRVACSSAGLRLLARLTPAGAVATDATTQVVYYAQRDDDSVTK